MWMSIYIYIANIFYWFKKKIYKQKYMCMLKSL